MPNKEKIIVIKPNRPNMKTVVARWRDGKLYDAPYYWWADKTRSNVARMRARERAVRQGRRDYSIEQILGVNPIPLLRGISEQVHELSVVEECKQRKDPLSLFLRSKLI